MPYMAISGQILDNGLTVKFSKETYVLNRVRMSVFSASTNGQGDGEAWLQLNFLPFPPKFEEQYAAAAYCS
jgi:hypothetical protein